MVNPGTERASSRRSRAPLSSMTVLGNGSDGSRRVDKRFGQLARSGLLHLVGCVWIGIGVGAGRGCRRRSALPVRQERRPLSWRGGGRLLLRLLGFDVERRQRCRWGRRLSQRDAGGTGGGKARGRQQARGRHFLLGRCRRWPACPADCAEIQELEPNSYIPPTHAHAYRTKVEDELSWLAGVGLAAARQGTLPIPDLESQVSRCRDSTSATRCSELATGCSVRSSGCRAAADMGSAVRTQDVIRAAARTSQSEHCATSGSSGRSRSSARARQRRARR